MLGVWLSRRIWEEEEGERPFVNAIRQILELWICWGSVTGLPGFNDGDVSTRRLGDLRDGHPGSFTRPNENLSIDTRDGLGHGPRCLPNVTSGSRPALGAIRVGRKAPQDRQRNAR